MADGKDDDMEDQVVVVPIDGELDLHTFAPRDVADLVAEYVGEAAAAGFAEVRIVHGKGTGALRRTVHAALERHPLVDRFALAPPDRGGWGGTIAWLRVSSKG